MQIQVNGEMQDVDAGETLADLLHGLEVSPRNIAIEYNGEFLDETADLGAVELEEDDQLEIVRFVGGG